MSSVPPEADIRGSDLVLAAAITVGLFAASLLALAHARLGHQADLPSIDPGAAIPIAVRPVADLPAGGGTQPGAAPTVPRAWRRKDAPSPEPAAEVTQPAIVEAKQPSHAPAKHPVSPAIPSEDSSPQPDASEPAPEPSVDTEQAEDPEQAQADTQDQAPSESAGDDAGDDAATDSGGAEDSGPPEPSPGEGGGQGGGETEGEGVPGGGSGTDPLFARAVAFYRARLVAWFSARFRVSGSHLSPEALTKHRVRVVIEIGDDLRIEDYRILSSDHPAFEDAARDMLEKLRGESLPPPPENYPGAVQHRLTVTFTCAEDTCD